MQLSWKQRFRKIESQRLPAAIRACSLAKLALEKKPFRVRKYESIETIGLAPKGFYQRSSFAFTTADRTVLERFLLGLASLNSEVNVDFHIQVGLTQTSGSTWFVLRSKTSAEAVREQLKVLSRFSGGMQCRVYPVPSEDLQYGRYLYAFRSGQRYNSHIENVVEFHGPTLRHPVISVLRQRPAVLRSDRLGSEASESMVSEDQILEVRHLIATTPRQVERLASLVSNVMPQANEITLDFLVYGKVNGVVQIPSPTGGAPTIFKIPRGAFWTDFDPPVTYSDVTTKKVVELIEAGEYPPL